MPGLREGRRVRRLAASIAVVVGVLAAWGAQAQPAPKVLRIIPSADLRILDPIWTTADVTRDYAYMVYDTLFALDGQAKPQPQMVETWTVSDDKLTYDFTLRAVVPAEPVEIGRAHV